MMRFNFRVSILSFVITIGSMLLFNANSWAASGRTLVNEGNKLSRYTDSTKKAEALERYLEARDKRKDRFEVPFNIATTYDKLGRTSEAMTWFEEAARSKDKKVKADAYYQMGNMLFRNKKYDEAIKSYTESLRSLPSDTNTRKNLELALMMKQVQPPDSNNQKDQDQKDPNKNQQDSTQQKKQQPQRDKMMEQAKEKEADLQKRLMQKRNQGEPGGSASGKDW